MFSFLFLAPTPPTYGPLRAALLDRDACGCRAITLPSGRGVILDESARTTGSCGAQIRTFSKETFFVLKEILPSSLEIVCAVKTSHVGLWRE